MKPFFITGLPRSRTAWLANLLTWGDAFCFHEATFGCSCMEDLKRTLERVPIGTRHVGDADPNLGLIAESIVQTFPGCRVVSIYRPLEECVESEWNAMTWDGHPAFENTTKDQIRILMQKASDGIAHLLRSLPKEKQVIVMYFDLEQEEVVRKIWRFCLPNTEFPKQRYELLQNLRVTQIFTKMLKKYPANPFQTLMNNAAVLENRAAQSCGA